VTAKAPNWSVETTYELLDWRDIVLDDLAQPMARRLRDAVVALPPMSTILCDIVASGGMQAALKDWLERHPEQALPPG